MFEIIRSYTRRYTVLMKMVFFYILFCVIAISVFSFFSLEAFSESSKQKINSTAISILSQSYNTADIVLTALYQNFDRLYNNEPIVLRFFSGQSFNEQDLLTLDRIIQKEIVMNPIVDSIYFYDVPSNKAYSSLFGLTTANEFLKRSSGDDLLDKTYDGQMFKPTTFFYKNLGRSYKTEVVSIPFVRINGDGSIRHAMVIHLNQHELKKMVPTKSTGAFHDLFILNKNGNVISNFGDEKEKPPKIIEKVQSSSEPRNSFVQKVDGDELFVSYIKGEGLGWTFIGIGRYDTLLQDFYDTQRKILLIAALFIGVGAIAVTMITRKIYKPIGEVLKEIDYGDAAKAKISESDYMRGLFHSLNTSVLRLEKDNSRLSFIEQNDRLVRFLKGDSTAEPPAVKLEGSQYIVLVALFPVMNEQEVSDKAASLKGEYVLLDSQKAAFMIGFHEKPFETIEGFVQDLPEGTVVGAGNPTTSLQELPFSYMEAEESLRYRWLLPEQRYISCAETGARKATRSDYPYELEKKVTASLKHRNKEKLLESNHLFFDDISRVSLSDIEIYLAKYLLSIVKLVKEWEDLHYTLEFQDIYTVTMQSATFKEAKQFTEGLLVDLLDEIHTVWNEQKGLEFEELADFIAKHMHNPDLSIHEAVAEFGMSRHHIRTIFKEKTGQTFHDYVMEARIEKGKKLLAATDDTAKHIAEQVGFADNRYFYVVFKNYTGETTSEYRKKHRKDEEK